MMIEQLMNEYGYRESGTDDLLMPHVLTDSNSVGYGGGVESLTEGSWPFDQTSEPNGSTPMATLDAQSYYPEPEPPAPSKYMYFEAAQANSTVGFYANLSTNPVFEYSSDGKTWQEWTYTDESVYNPDSSGSTTLHVFEEIPLPKIGDKVYLKGVNPDGINNSWFSLTGSLYCHGNAQSLVDGDEPTLVAKRMPSFNGYGAGEPTALLSAPELPATTLADGCYRGMFESCTSLTEAPELPATTLTENCYSYMFYECTSLTQAPELPATTLEASCYSNMFAGCTSLIQAPELPATTLASGCYYSMFSGCTSLTQAPELPATALAESCYSGMFAGCASLTQAPELPATALAESCYRGMFAGCKSLTLAPELPATTLAERCYESMFYECTSLTQVPELPITKLESYCYYQMFYGCTSLTEAPELPATTLTESCYGYMFAGCTSLSNVTCLATDISAGYCTTNWLYNVAQSGTFTKASSMNNWQRGASGIPDGWVVSDHQG